MRWETPTVVSYGEDQLLADQAVGALSTPVFCDLPFMDASDGGGGRRGHGYAYGRGRGRGHGYGWH